MSTQDIGSTGSSGQHTRIGLVLADSQRESETQTFLQGRLVLFYGVLLSLAAFLYVASSIITAIANGWGVRSFLGIDKLIHIASMAITGVVYVLLRRRSFGERSLRALDLLGIYLFAGTAIIIYALIYEMAVHSMPAFLSIFLIARAIVVPSPGRTTFLMSVPVVLAFMAVQLSYGVAYADTNIPMEASHFAPYVLWNQLVLWTATCVAALASSMQMRLRVQANKARKLGQYKIERTLGAGAMGEVFEATHAMLRRPTAIKLLRPDITGVETIQRFEREVRETSVLSHPNTVRIYDFGHTPDGLFYYAMELLDGRDLADCVKAHGPMPPARVIHILSQACGALKEAHDHGLVHRDIKPGNLMLVRRAGEHDVVKVVDFGLVKDLGADSSLTQVGTVCGTPETMAPEIVMGREASASSDLYSLGAVGYFLLTGVPVFDVDAPMQFLTSHMNEEPTAPSSRRADVPADLDAVILRCLRKEPEDRFAGAGDLRAALARCKDARLWTETHARRWWNETKFGDAPRP